MRTLSNQDRRKFCISSLLLAAGVMSVDRLHSVHAATMPDAAALIAAMVAALQASSAWSFTAETILGETSGQEGLTPLPARASVSFLRGEGLLAVYGPGSADIHLLVREGEAVLFRPSLAVKAVLGKGSSPSAAFAFPGLFLPFMGFLGADVTAATLGKISSVTAIAEGQPDQPETTALAEVIADRFTGEIWVNLASRLPARIIGTYMPGDGGASVSAATSYSDWRAEALLILDFDATALDVFRTVSLPELLL